jgi:hypothetical protein
MAQRIKREPRVTITTTEDAHQLASDEARRLNESLITYVAKAIYQRAGKKLPAKYREAELVAA